MKKILACVATIVLGAATIFAENAGDRSVHVIGVAVPTLESQPWHSSIDVGGTDVDSDFDVDLFAVNLFYNRTKIRESGFTTLFDCELGYSSFDTKGIKDGVGGVDSKWLWGWGYAPINWDRFMLAVLGTFGVNLTANFHSETAEIPTTKGNVVGVDALELALALYATVGATVQAIYRISDHFGIFGSVHMYTNPIGAGLFGYIYDGGDGYGEGDADGGRIGFGGFDFAARFGLSFTY